MKNEKLIQITKLFMVLGGLWKLPFTKNTSVKRIYFIFSIFMRANFIIFWILLFMELIRVIREHADIMNIIFLNLAIIINASKIASKVIIFQKNNVPELYSHVIKEEKLVWEDNDVQIVNTYSKLVKYCSTLMFCQTMSTVVVVLSFFYLGVSSHNSMEKYNTLTNQTLEGPFLYQYWFPHKRDHIVVVYALNAWFGYLCIVYNSVTHMMYTNLMVFVASQFKMMQIRLRKLDVIAVNTYNGNVLLALKKYIKDHQYLISFVQRLNESTKNIVLMEFLLSSLDCASVAAQAIRIKAASDSVFLVFYFSLMVLQIFVLGWTTNEIKVQSLAISDAIYESKWHLFDKETTQLLQIMMMRAQDPLTMRIGPFGPITTETPLLIMKAAYSYVTIMIN
nr:odorant receptor 7 [Pachyrhinus yasumatsui]